VHEPDLTVADLRTITLTTQERRVLHRALTMSSALLDAIGDIMCAASCLELADRVLPEGDE
jgi:aspartyl/asparaginyl beta-hydroxylase (cupin superfamily)